MEEGARSIKDHSPSGYHEQDQGQGWRFVLQFGASAAALSLFWWILSYGPPGNRLQSSAIS